jgi:hypothetical protein
VPGFKILVEWRRVRNRTRTISFWIEGAFQVFFVNVLVRVNVNVPGKVWLSVPGTFTFTFTSTCTGASFLWGVMRSRDLPNLYLGSD